MNNLLQQKGYPFNKPINLNSDFTSNNRNLLRNTPATKKTINNNIQILNKSNSAKKIENKKFYYDNGNLKEKSSQNEVSLISVKQDCSTITRFSNKSLIQAYLDRRHLETQKKIIRLRHEKLADECSALSFKPKISENSKYIVRNIIQRENPDRVSNSTFIANHASNVDVNCNNNYNAADDCFDKNFHNYTASGKKKNAKQKFTKLDDYIKIAERRGIMENNIQEKRDNRNNNSSYRPASVIISSRDINRTGNELSKYNCNKTPKGVNNHINYQNIVEYNVYNPNNESRTNIPNYGQEHMIYHNLKDEKIKYMDDRYDNYNPVGNTIPYLNKNPEIEVNKDKNYQIHNNYNSVNEPKYIKYNKTDHQDKGFFNKEIINNNYNRRYLETHNKSMKRTCLDKGIKENCINDKTKNLYELIVIDKSYPRYNENEVLEARAKLNQYYNEKNLKRIYQTGNESSTNNNKRNSNFNPHPDNSNLNINSFINNPVRDNNSELKAISKNILYDKNFILDNENNDYNPNFKSHNYSTNVTANNYPINSNDNFLNNDSSVKARKINENLDINNIEIQQKKNDARILQEFAVNFKNQIKHENINENPNKIEKLSVDDFSNKDILPKDIYSTEKGNSKETSNNTKYKLNHDSKSFLMEKLNNLKGQNMVYLVNN